MLEKDFQSTVVKLARQYGWLWAHIPTLTRRQTTCGDGGFTDLVLVHEATGAKLFVELKRDGEKLDPKQERWRAAITRDSGNHAVWRPEDLPAAVRILSNPRALLRGEPCGHL